MHGGSRGAAIYARAAAATVALFALAAGLAALTLALGLGERDSLDLTVSPIAIRASAAAAPEQDPFAWDPAKRADFEQRAALGASRVIYEMSPGGVVASARRTARFRSEIEAAAVRHGIDPDVLEAVVFLESAGRPQVIAGPTPESAAGLAQILPSTATDLLGMQVDLPRSIELTRQVMSADDAERARRLLAERAAVDERFDPAAALEGAAAYLEIAGDRFGGEDLAVAAYHMGIGNLESVIRAYAKADEGRPIGQVVAEGGLSYAQLYFDSSPTAHRRAYEMLHGFGDESADYLWKVRESERIMSLYRDDRGKLAETADLATSKASLEEVFHPQGETNVFDDPGEIEDALGDGDLVPLAFEPDLGWIPDKQMGELAPKLDEEPQLYRALRPEALATLSYLARLVVLESDDPRPLLVTSSVRDLSYQDLLVASNPEATTEYSLHTTGWSFDIKRDYASGAQATAFQNVIDRLSALALIDYAVEPGAIHVTVSSLGKRLLATG